jgi:predicted ester cyclase
MLIGTPVLVDIAVTGVFLYMGQSKGGFQMNIKEFAQKFMEAEEEAWQKGNFDPLEALEDPNVVYHFLPSNELVGFEAHKQQILGYREAISKSNQEWKFLTGDGNVFALSYKSRYISSGKVPGLPPAGEEITGNSMFVFRLNNGKIVEAWQRGGTT